MLDRLRKWLQLPDLPEAQLESLDRRAFLRGLTVTAAGLVVPMGTLFLPAPEPGRIIRFQNGGFTMNWSVTEATLPHKAISEHWEAGVLLHRERATLYSEEDMPDYPHPKGTLILGASHA